ncbi:MAG: hypothetical protein LBE18_04555 [Planctomycetaceae bacterium]|nr:hypothetical protein [Planctomycetaceae bacterium]
MRLSIKLRGEVERRGSDMWEQKRISFARMQRAIPLRLEGKEDEPRRSEKERLQDVWILL